MHLGQHELQILGSLVVFLGTAVVAFICDFLMRKNDELRKLTAELKVRHEEELRRAYQMTAKPAPVEQVAGQVPAAVARKEKKRPVNSEALAVMERGAALAGSAQRPQLASAVVGKRDWGSLLSRTAQAAAEPPLPAGFQDGFVLSKLVERRQPVSGLVVSIGVNASRKSLPESVGQLMQSLIGPQDFAAQSGEDEFLLICPRERGAAAQRRLSQIAQQLWDFQLRSLGSSQILFSWGGVEVRSESIEEAIASASERMQETKRGRKLPAVGQVPDLPASLLWLQR